MRTRVLRCRLFSGRVLALLLFMVAFGAYCYYYNTRFMSKTDNRITGSELNAVKLQFYGKPFDTIQTSPDQCTTLKESTADIDTVDVYPQFEFQPSWVRTKEFWDKNFEDRYENIRGDPRRPKLKVIVVPHSHNDPGWLKTFEQYFEWKTKDIINNIVTKLNQYPNMTFIWSEISFLNLWWESSHPVKQRSLKKLIKEGRLEITTGGWVMPDEACTHIYALIDQLIEGHNWVKNKLGVSPKSGWSIDPFGHGPTVPHLLDKSGLDGTIIQRIHYAWKQWLAERQVEEFHWIPGWSAKKPNLIVHNLPFDIYSIKGSCGPHPDVCLSFDFRHIAGEYSEYTAKYEYITPQNLHSKSKTLFGEYSRIGTLTPHNVVLVPLGDDFRYEHSEEFDAQYTNYMKMFEYINSHQEIFNADVSFGTLLDYFQAVKERQKVIPSLKGDFFVYADVFSEGRPAYWSGYYTTRPYIKLLARQLEHQLRTSEILFTLVSNRVKQLNNPKLISSEKGLERSYQQLINARRNLGLFQHHDAITGTSKAGVMRDYGTKLFMSLYNCIRLQELALTTVMVPDVSLHSKNILQSEVEWETYGKPVKNLRITIVNKTKVILFNSLAESRTEVIKIRSDTPNMRIYDTRKKEYVLYQISPNIIVRDGILVISDKEFDVLFVASLPPLSAVTFNLEEHVNTSHHSIVFCNNCVNEEMSKHPFVIKPMMPGDIQLENSVLKLLINRNTGFLKQVYRKDVKTKNIVEIQFGAYQSAQRHSGAYLFMPDYDAPEKLVLNSYASDDQDDYIVILAGPVTTEITTMYLPFLVHTAKIYTVNDPALSRGILIENVVDFESPPKNRETELFMRIQTDIQNGEVPEFYTDQNGFQYQKRVKVEKINIEGNYYPITTMAWLQDEKTRMTLLTNHAQGASAFMPGLLEVMLDRRTLYDDYRGMGEGVVDNKLTVFQNWLLLEAMSDSSHQTSSEKNKKKVHERHFNTDHTKAVYELPSLTADYLSRALNFPVNIYLLDTRETGEVTLETHQRFVENFPPGIHLFTMRTITDDILDEFPSTSCYMVLQRPGYSCSIGHRKHVKSTQFTSKTAFSDLKIKNFTAVSLTGLKRYKSLLGLGDIKLETMDIKTFEISF